MRAHVLLLGHASLKILLVNLEIVFPKQVQNILVLSSIHVMKDPFANLENVFPKQAQNTLALSSIHVMKGPPVNLVNL